MTSAESLARFALSRAAELPPAHRMDLLEAAAEHLPPTLASEARRAAFHLREAESRQLLLKELVDQEPFFPQS